MLNSNLLAQTKYLSNDANSHCQQQEVPKQKAMSMGCV